MNYSNIDDVVSPLSGKRRGRPPGSKSKKKGSSVSPVSPRPPVLTDESTVYDDIDIRATSTPVEDSDSQDVSSW